MIRHFLSLTLLVVLHFVRVMTDCLQNQCCEIITNNFHMCLQQQLEPFVNVLACSSRLSLVCVAVGTVVLGAL